MFKYALVIILLLEVSLLLPANAESTPVISKVDQVTLFSDQARIVRQGRASLKAGRNVLQFEGLPERLNPDSLQISGRGQSPVMIVGVEHRKRFLEQEASQELRSLEEKIELQTRELNRLNLNLARLQNEKEQIEKISLVQSIPEQSGQILRPPNAKEMGELLAFKSEAGSRINSEIVELTEKSVDLQKQLELLKKQAAELQPGRRSESLVEVVVSAQKETAATIDLSYQVGQAKWSPAYHLDVKESEAQPEFVLDMYGLISQQTGEDWVNVKLLLSTARPHLGLNRPTPYPHYLDVFKDAPQATAPLRTGRMLQMESMLPSEPEVGASADANLEEFSESSANVQEGEVITFEISEAVTIRSGSSTEKVKVAGSALEGKLTFVAVPAMMPYVYREALLQNTTPFPIISGSVNLFSDGSFVGKNWIAHTPRNQEFRLPVGISEELLVEHKLAKRFEEDSGIIKAHRKIRSDYEITAKNLSSKERDLIVLEPVYLSRNEKIIVKLTAQKPPPLQLDVAERIQAQEGILEWQVKLAPKAEQVIRHSVIVEFPADLSIAGLWE